MQLLTAITGFEDQRAHQHPSAPKCLSSIAQKNLFGKKFCFGEGVDNRRITQKPWGRLWNFVPLKGEGEAGSGGDCSDVVETWSREAGGCALYATDTRIGCRLSLPEKPPTGRFFWIVRIGSLLGGFSLTKAPSFAIRISDCKIHPQRRLTIKSFARCDVRPAGAARWTPATF